MRVELLTVNQPAGAPQLPPVSYLPPVGDLSIHLDTESGPEATVTARQTRAGLVVTVSDTYGRIKQMLVPNPNGNGRPHH